MKIRCLTIICCILFLLSGCAVQYQRINLGSDALADELAMYIDADTVVVNTVDPEMPEQIPIYAITERKISQQEFRKMEQQLEISGEDSSWYYLEYEGNRINGTFAAYVDHSRDDFDMTEEDLESLAWETFHKLPFMEGEYVYSGIKGEYTRSNSTGEHILRVLVSFYRLLDNARVIGNERCDMWFDGNGLVELYIERYNYEKIGTMDMIPLEDASARIKTPDAFSIDITDTDSTNMADTLQVDKIKLLLVNQYSQGCTILQPVYSFTGTATLTDGSQADFASRIIAIPETYTYEKPRSEDS